MFERNLEKICIGKFSKIIIRIIILKNKHRFPFFKNNFCKILDLFSEINIKNVKRKIYLFGSFIFEFSVVIFYLRQSILNTILFKKSSKKKKNFKFFIKFFRKIIYFNPGENHMTKNKNKGTKGQEFLNTCKKDHIKNRQSFLYNKLFSLKICINHREYKNIYFNEKTKKKTVAFLLNITMWGNIFFPLFKKIKNNIENVNISNRICISYIYTKKKTYKIFLTVRKLLFWKTSFLFYKFICPIGKITTNFSGYVSSCGHFLSKISIKCFSGFFYYKNKIDKKALFCCTCCPNFDTNLKHLFLGCDFFKFVIHN